MTQNAPKPPGQDPASGMALTPELVALSIRPEPDLGPDPSRRELGKAELDALTDRYDRECGEEPCWVFAYGSLIWKPEFPPAEQLRATAYGWHRSFCLKMTRWRGSPEQVGLMLALERGGRCDAVIQRLPDRDRWDHLRAVLHREVRFREHREMSRWIPVRTPAGPRRALAFWCGPVGERVMRKLPLEEVAQILARACGHAGSCAEYLYNTVAHLDEHGIRDRNLWRLQELVAEEIAGLHGTPPPSAGP